MTSYNVLVQPSGRKFVVPSEQTVLAAALAAGITLPHGCKNGACGSCKGKVIAGSVRHGTHAEAALSATEEAAGLALFCCARPSTDLVIEARIAAALDGIVPHKMPGRIERIQWPAQDVAILSVRLPASEHLQFRAGQYMDFIFSNGVRRSYSIASMPRGRSSFISATCRAAPSPMRSLAARIPPCASAASFDSRDRWERFFFAKAI
jgi:CDP-4-dehydro-6-deoxyglucose reductase